MITVARSRILQAPPTSEWPDATNTGVPPGTSLTPSGDVTTSTNGQTIQDLDIAGQIVIEHDNVLVRRCRIEMVSIAAIYFAPGTTGVIVEDCELTGDQGSAIFYEGGDATLTRLDISGCENGFSFNADNLTITDCYIHDLEPIGGDPHTDGLQCSADTGNLLVEHCNFQLDTGFPVSAGIQTQNLDATNHDWLVNNTRVICANGGPSSGALPIRIPSVDATGQNIRFTNLVLSEGEFGYVNNIPPEDFIDEWSAVDWITGDPVP